MTADAPSPDVAPAGPIVDIRADLDRDGKIDLEGDNDDRDEDKWTNERGAIFLANIDDDERRCQFSAQLSDDEIVRCNDAADEVVNGAADEADLAKMLVKPWPLAPNGTTWMVKVNAEAANYVRLFIRDSGGSLTVYKPEPGPAGTLRAGFELRIEAKDIVRDRTMWDGFVDVTLEVDVDGKKHTDTVRLRVAPLLLHHQVQKANGLFVARDIFPDSKTFVSSFDAATTAANAPKAIKLDVNDQWAQDYFETGYMVMPKAGGGQQVIDVFIRSANVFNPQSKSFPLREAGRIVFAARGPGVAAIQQFDVRHSQEMDTLNSNGNLEVVPPHVAPDGKNHAFGRILRGSVATFFPDPTFQKLLDSQGVQPTIKIDTSWLLVGHVDETLSFVPTTSSARGWTVLVNDAAMAVKMLTDAATAGHRDVKMFQNKFWLDQLNRQLPAETTIGKLLDDTEIMAATAEAAIQVQKQKDILKREVGLRDEEFVSVPFTHYYSDGYSLAYQPGTVNGVVITNTDFIAPVGHGPVVDGVDVFKDQFEKAVAPHGITVRWVENWDLLHRLSGEVHCGSNARREIPADASWWKVIQ
ncbi:MAG: protein-arginine deiminase [Myxococcales bacterium]|nr:protein-arginine deiminase [Myxococcales bacterium]